MSAVEPREHHRPGSFHGDRQILREVALHCKDRLQDIIPRLRITVEQLRLGPETRQAQHRTLNMWPGFCFITEARELVIITTYASVIGSSPSQQEAGVDTESPGAQLCVPLDKVLARAASAAS